ncbi:hypothetical protein ACFX1Q_021062 [Malus domestica]
MPCPSDCHLNLNVGEDIDISSPDNIWQSSFLSSNGSLTVRDSVMRNDTTATVVARNLLTPRDNRILSKRSDEQAARLSSLQCPMCRLSIKHGPTPYCSISSG